MIKSVELRYVVQTVVISVLSYISSFDSLKKINV